MKYKSKFKRKAQVGIGEEPQFLLPGSQPNYNWMQTTSPSIVNPNGVTPGPVVTAEGDAADMGKIVPMERDEFGNVYAVNERKYKVGTGRFKENPYVKGFNYLASGVTGIANMIQNNRLKDREYETLVRSLEPTYWENMEGEGLNNLPMYTQYGGGFGPNLEDPGIAHEAFYGDISVYQAGGGPSQEKAKKMLEDGTVNGKPLTEAQKRYFGWIAGGSKKQAGGIADLLWQNGINGSFANRKKLFNDYFAGNYTGTAEQNIKLYNDITSGKLTVPGQGKARILPKKQDVGTKSGNAVRTIQSAARQAQGETKPALQSGVVVDKRKNQAYVVKDGKVQKQFPVITGKNQDLNSNPYTVEFLDKNPNLRNTPMGAYFLDPRNNIYGAPGFDMNPLYYDGVTPNAANLAMHITYDPANRDKYYGTEQANKSYGCINCRKPDLDYVRQQFPQGDTVMVIDSKKGQSLKKMGIKQAGGECDDCGKTKKMTKGKKYQTGGLVFYQGANTSKGGVTPTGQSNAFSNSGMTQEQVYELARKYGFRTDNNRNFQTDLLSYAQQNRPDAYDAMLQKFGQTAAGTFADNILGARTMNLLEGIQTTPVSTPPPVQKSSSVLDQWMYGTNKHAIGAASRPFTEHTNNQVTKTDQFGQNPQFVDFMFNKKDSQELDSARGTFRIPYNVWSNEMTKGTTTLFEPGMLDQYRMPSSTAGVKQTGGSNIPNVYGLPDGMEQFADVEAEAGEVIQTQGGGYVKVADDANTHEEGGELIPGVKRVLEDTADKRKDPASKTLKVTPQMMEDAFGIKIKSPITHAKAFEIVNKELGKTNKLYQTAKKDANLRENLDKTAMNTLRLNEQLQGELPTEDDIFNALFMHQEGVKAVAGINDDGSMAQYGGHKKQKVAAYQAGGLKGKQNVQKDLKTPKGNINQVNFPGGLPALVEKWKGLIPGIENVTDPAEFQRQTYAYLLKNQPELIDQTIWGEGLNRAGINMFKSGKDKAFNEAVGRAFDPKTFAVKPGYAFTQADREALASAYPDSYLMNRLVVPEQTTTVTDVPETAVTETPKTVFNPGVTINPRIVKQPNNQFYEPTYWSDVAAPLAGMVDSFRRWPELYNPMEFNQLRYKLLDPTAQLTANQADFNAALAETTNMGTGAGNANVANMLGQKYRVNNQVLSQYDNQNAQIKNNEITYNTQVRDKQSVANAQSRAQFYRDVLLGREAQRQQFLTSLGQLSRVDQLKRRQNTSGNLLMKLSPAFDQFGEYNGYQYMPYLDPSMLMYTDTPKNVTKKKTTNTTTWKDASGKVHKTSTTE